MKENKRTQILLDATEGIREAYIEEAAVVRHTRPLWAKLAAAAAVVVLVIGLLGLLWLDAPEGTPMSFLTIQAHAADGSIETLRAVGDTCKLKTGTSELFPGKEVYILDVLFMDAAGDRLDLGGNDFQCFHHGKYLKPGQTDEQINISWVEKDGLFGYRIVGWCEDFDLMNITIRDSDGRILHQKELRIDYDGQYHANVRVSYNYEPQLTTEQLITKLLDSGQDYSHHLMFASSLDSAYSSLVRFYGGFAELEQREDAASLLLQRWVKEMEASEYTFASVEGSGMTGLILYQDAHWKNLTEEELALIESYGYSTERPEKQNPFFPGKKTFTYDLILEGKNTNGHCLTVSYKDQAVQGKDEHLIIAFVVSSAYADSPSHGWSVMGWFDEPTILMLTVTDKEDTVVLKQTLLIIPTEDDYKINILWETP